MIATAIITYMAIYIYSKYLDSKLKNDFRGQAQFATPFQKADQVSSKYTVSSGSAFFFILVLIGGLLVRYGSRNTRLFFLIPLQNTEMSVLFPCLIILKNPKLKKDFFQFFSKPFKNSFFICSSSNLIDPNI